MDAFPEGLVRFLPAVSYEKSIDLMASAEILLVCDVDAPSSVFFPSKLADYMGTDVPILGLVPPGPAARLIPRAGGLVVHPRDPGAVADALATLLRNSAPGRARLTAEQKQFRATYAFRNVARGFESLLVQT